MQISRRKRVGQASKEDQFTFSGSWLTEPTSSALKASRPFVSVRRGAPKTTPVFATYWKFAKRRQDLFFSKILGSEHQVRVFDPILSQYRFTNVYRASDRVSQFLIRHVLYNREWEPNDLLFRLLVFKFFNKIDTWHALEAAVGEITWESYNFDAYDACLSQLMAAGSTIYSAAYIMPAGQEAFGHQRKHRNHLKIIESAIRAGAADHILQARSLENVFQTLCTYPCIGPFVGYQLAIDVNYSTLVDFAENDFVVPGPGALDGISKCFSDIGDYTATDVIRYMTDIQEEALTQFAPGFQTLWGRPLQLIDCQNIFCEVSKYARVAHPDVPGVAQRKRIKQNYRPASGPIEQPWYPPKWDLNRKIAADNRLAI